jgi:hypothetical protein
LGVVPVYAGVENAVPFHWRTVSVPLPMNMSSAVGPPKRAKKCGLAVGAAFAVLVPDVFKASKRLPLPTISCVVPAAV